MGSAGPQPPERMSDRHARLYRPERMPEDIYLYQKMKKQPKQNSRKNVRDVSEDMPDRMPEDITKECHEICQTECQRKCQQICQTKCQKGMLKICHGRDHSKKAIRLLSLYGAGLSMLR